MFESPSTHADGGGQVLSIDGDAVEKEDVVRRLRGPDQVGTLVTLKLKRAVTGREEVLCPAETNTDDRVRVVQDSFCIPSRVLFYSTPNVT